MSDKATEMVAKTQSKVHTIKMKGIYGGLDGTYARARRAEKYRNKGRAHNVHVGAITRYIWGKRKVRPTPRGVNVGGCVGCCTPPGEIGQAAKGPRPLQMCMRTVLL